MAIFELSRSNDEREILGVIIRLMIIGAMFVHDGVSTGGLAFFCLFQGELSAVLMAIKETTISC